MLHFFSVVWYTLHIDQPTASNKDDQNKGGQDPMKKRVLSILVLAMVLATMIPVMSASALIGPQYVSTSNGKGVHMRTGPSKNDPIIMTIPFGARVDTYEYYNNSWGYVSYNGMYGFCMSRYFSSTKPSKPSPTPTAAPKPSESMFKGFAKTDYFVTVRPATPSAYVNLRWAPSKSQAIQGKYYAGYAFQVIAENGTWAQVYDASTDTCGFMMRSFLTVTDVGVAN